MNKVEQLLNSSVLYNPLRYSFLSNIIVETLTKKTSKNINYYNSFLPQKTNDKTLVFDIGANKGNKTDAFLKMGYDVVCLEPERMSVGTLKYRFSKSPKVHIVEKGVSDIEKSLNFHVHRFRSGFNTFSDKWVKMLGNGSSDRVGESITIQESYVVNMTTLDSLIRLYGLPVFIKIDVEGYELEVIKGLSMKVPYLSFEANLPEFKAETMEIINLLYTIDNSVRFKIAYYENIQQDAWLSKADILSVIDKTDYSVIEVITHYP